MRKFVCLIVVALMLTMITNSDAFGRCRKAAGTGIHLRVHNKGVTACATQVTVTTTKATKAAPTPAVPATKSAPATTININSNCANGSCSGGTGRAGLFGGIRVRIR